MADIWLPGVEREPLLGCTGPNTYEGSPYRVVLHTLEGGWDSGMSTFRRNPCYVPHFIFNPHTGRLKQLIPLNWASAALANDAGGVETNRANAIQIEMEGFSKDTHTWPDSSLRNLAKLLTEIRKFIPFQYYGPDLYGLEAGFTLATKNARQRFTFAYWNGFNGVCGHQNVPENEHWDPGNLNLVRVFEHCHDIEGTSPTTPGDGSMSKEDVENLKAFMDQRLKKDAEQEAKDLNTLGVWMQQQTALNQLRLFTIGAEPTVWERVVIDGNPFRRRVDGDHVSPNGFTETRFLEAVTGTAVPHPFDEDARVVIDAVCPVLPH